MLWLYKGKSLFLENTQLTYLGVKACDVCSLFLNGSGWTVYIYMCVYICTKFLYVNIHIYKIETEYAKKKNGKMLKILIDNNR